MTRDLTTDLATEFEGASIHPLLIAEFDFDSARLRLWSGYGTLVWGGFDYLGAGNLAELSTLQETQGLEAKGIVLTLNGIPETLISLAFNERTRGRPFRMWLGALNSSSALIADPYRCFTGLMDVMEITDDGTNAQIRLSVESSMLYGQRSKLHHYTSEDQKSTYPTDKGLDQINGLIDQEVVW